MPAPTRRLALLAVLALITCREDETRSPTAATTPRLSTASLSATPATLVGAGNIARCDRTNDEATAQLLDQIPGTVFAVGDNAYNQGSLQQYNQCYSPSWGRHKARTSPAPGERDYQTANASGYFSYFGAAAGDPANGYYSYDAGPWHVVVLNSGNTKQVPTSAGSPQVTWLQADLAAHPTRCTLAYWHHPLFDSKDPPNTAIRPLWDVLYNAGVDVVVNAHYGFYERFAPQTPAGVADPAFGIREFIAGTGGANDFQNPDHVRPNSEVRNANTYGVLKLTLDTASYSWEFVPVAGKTFHDSGTGSCHNAPPIVVNAGPDQTASIGSATTLSVAFTDPSPSPPWSYTIDWGDGTSSNGSATASPFGASHSYAAEGLDSVRVRVTNNAGNSGADSLAVRVSSSVILVGAGDIADCTRNGDSLTANLMDTIPGTVFAAGDDAYPNGAPSDYTNCYAPTWGRFKARTRPVPGNHDYNTAGASGYYSYFGAAAGDPTKGYYSYDLGAWHVIALNSNIAMGTGSAQEQWLKADLAANPRTCTLAYWHHPLFSSSTIAVDTMARAAWRDLYAAGAELVIVGHHHDYERFAPQTPDGTLDQTFGIREIVAGTGGGEGLFAFGTTAANSLVRNNSTFGVLKLTLQTGGYSWRFIPVAGATFSDTGSSTCHGAPGGAPPPSNHPPTARAGGPYSGTEGAVVSFDGSGSTDPDGDSITYSWSFGDGTFATGVKPTHRYVDNGSYTVTLTVTDAFGAAGTPDTTTATIANAAPAVSAGPSQTVGTGGTATITVTFTDPGTSDAPWSYSVDWGDGTLPSGGSTSNQTAGITVTHTYMAPGSDFVRATVTDKDGGAGSGTATVTVSPTPPPPPPPAVTFVGAGNIARCDHTNDEATAAILDTIPGTVFALGDNAFPGGTPSAYQNCYDPTWGRQKSRTYPVLGNHEYDSSATAAGYFGYFGAVAGDPTKGYYSVDLGSWHIVVLNSNSTFVSTAAGSPQEQWLKADLAASTKTCQLALFHTPRFYSTTSASFFPTGFVKPFWDDLYAAGAELIINAHMRDYERFAPQDPAGTADPAKGIREFIVGTGGDGLDAANSLIIPNSEVNISGAYGVLKLTLGDGTYSWQFVPAGGQTATDSGSGSCH